MSKESLVAQTINRIESGETYACPLNFDLMKLEAESQKLIKLIHLKQMTTVPRYISTSEEKTEPSREKVVKSGTRKRYKNGTSFGAPLAPSTASADNKA